MKKSIGATIIILVVIFLATAISGSILLGVALNNADFKLAKLFPDSAVEIDEAHTRNLTGINTIELKNIAAKITITSAGAKESTVTATLKGTYFHTTGKKITFDMKAEGSKLTFAQSSGSGFNLGYNFEDTSLVLIVPTDYTGELKLTNCAAKIDAFTSSESPKLSGFASTNGAGKLDAVGYFKNIEIVNSAGKINIREKGEVGTISIKNSAGKVTLTLPKNTKGSIEISNNAGKVESDFPLRSGEYGNYWGDLNGGGDAKISIQNSAGKIDIIAS
ncbi:MAG: DUF4097 domain-containing protein [Oscillospiraceae bacterium]|jgi:hypothetical protein|nr:DUF4097 domain-containing protein [Oscillospiraceae bacterium]